MRILFICHRMPYPPDKGDKIRSYNILKYLAQKHEVHLAFILDEKKDNRSLEVLSSMVESLCFASVRPVPGKLLSSAALLRSRPISVSFFYSRKIQKWVDELLDDRRVDAVLCYSSPTAEYLFRSRHFGAGLKRLPLAIDLVDVDSYKWEQYAERSTGIMSKVYGLEAKYLRRYEERIAEEFSHIILSTEAERALFLDRISAANTQAMANGVDSGYFSRSLAPRISASGPVLTFVGAMDYYPNADGVSWFVQNVYSRIRQIYPKAMFYIVGNRPSAAVRRLAQTFPGVEVTGYVEDVRTYLARADVCVVPLHIARGIQNKVLEAMAMGKPLVCTPQAVEGIRAEPGKEVLTAADAGAFAGAVIGLLDDPNRAMEMGARARAFIERHFSWQNNLATLDGIFTAGA